MKDSALPVGSPGASAREVRIKSLAFRSTLDFVREKGGEAAVLATLQALPAEAREALSRPLLATLYLPFPWLVETMRAGARALGGDRSRVFWEMGEHSCEQALTGIYRIFLKVGSPEFILRRSSRLFETYFQGVGEMRVVDQEKGFSKLEVDPFPGGHADYCRRLDGYFETVLRLSGAREIELVHDECGYRGGRICRWTGRWK